MNGKWAYLNDLENVEVLNIYALNHLIEICYRKGTHTQSLSIGFTISDGTMGYAEYFSFDSIPLPPAKTLHPLNGVIRTIKTLNLYAHVSEYERFEELEVVSEEGNYLLYFKKDEQEMPFAQVEKDKKPTLPIYAKEISTFPKELFSVESFKANLAYALMAHGEQKTPHGLPYSMHLFSVAAEVIAALSIEPLSYDENNVAIACALLHDINEDTSFKVTKDSPIAGAKEVIVKGVAALTKDKSLSSKELQMMDSLRRLKSRQNCVAMVKLADRITNLGIPPEHWDIAKKRAYVHEAKLILEELGYSHQTLAKTLEEKIKNYTLYL